MEILGRDNLIDTLKYMLKIAEESPKDAFFMTNCEFAQIDKAFQERSHKLGLERALKLQEEADKRAEQIQENIDKTKKDNI